MQKQNTQGLRAVKIMLNLIEDKVDESTYIQRKNTVQTF